MNRSSVAATHNRAEPAEPEALDATDLRLLALLQRDAALTNQALADAAHVSPATSLRRVKRMQDRGVIMARVALLAPERIGPSLTAVVEVALDRQGAEHLLEFERRCVDDPSVRHCYRVAPGPDFVLVTQVRDMDEWMQVVERLFTQQANVRNIKTFFVTRRAKFDTSCQLP